MKKWEYSVVRLADNDWEKQKSYLDIMGVAGWNLIAVLDGLAYLKRRLLP